LLPGSRGTARSQRSTKPTAADLLALDGGKSRLLTVLDVARILGVCDTTVYRLCERGDLPHIRIVNSIRIRPADVKALIRGR
jgi:excisionase family DNA binding protein